MPTPPDEAAGRYSTQLETDVCCQEIRALLVKHGMGGLVVVVSPDGSTAFVETPPWAKVRVASAGLTLEATTADEIALVLHFLRSIPDQCRKFGILFATFFQAAKQFYKRSGVEGTFDDPPIVDHDDEPPN